ncbi:MAG TPA: hypothetical protein VHM19_17860 [Polyangiales bacterium]|nr:hypothetical protein [Polyangiales bacterium]
MSEKDAKMKWQQIQDTRLEPHRRNTNPHPHAGKRGRLVGALQARYDMLKDDAEAQFDAWMRQALRTDA